MNLEMYPLLFLCRHGGHAGCIIKWFMEHLDCPVTGCTCKCAQLDSGL